MTYNSSDLLRPIIPINMIDIKLKNHLNVKSFINSLYKKVILIIIQKSILSYSVNQLIFIYKLCVYLFILFIYSTWLWSYLDPENGLKSSANNSVDQFDDYFNKCRNDGRKNEKIPWRIDNRLFDGNGK